MSYAQIGIAQAAFPIVLFLCQITAGRIADLYSHKWCNVSGNLLAAAAYFAYANAESFYSVVLAECAIGVGLAFSEGADTALQRHYASRVARSAVAADDLFAQVSVRIAKLRQGGRCFAYLIGGWAVVSQPRLAICLVGVVFTIAAAVVLCVPNIHQTQRRAGEVLRSIKHEGRDTIAYVRSTWQHGPLRWRMLAMAICVQVPAAIMMVLFTQLLIAAGAPDFVVGISWIAFIASCWAGAHIPGFKRVARQTPLWHYTCLCAVFAMSTVWLVFGVNLWCVLLLLGLGVVIGWTDAIAGPVVLKALQDKENVATVMSVHRTIEAIVASIAFLVTGFVSTSGPRNGVLVCLVMFVLVASIIWFKLRRHG